MSKNIIIIGAGISGLSAAVYARKAGHNVTVLEKCQTPGGVAACWVRKGYTFDGGVHWLVGSTPRFGQFYRHWVETGALQENNPIEYSDMVFEYRNGEVTLRLWRDVDRLAQELLAFASEDAKAIRRLQRDVHLVASFLGTPQGVGEHLRRICHFPVSLPTVLHLITISTEKYVSRFHNPYLREMLSAVLNVNQNAISLVTTLAGYHMGDNGFPIGGSRRLSQNMADTATALGCTIKYNTCVEEVCIEQGCVRGVMVSGHLMPADAVIVAMDTCTALRTLFHQPLQEFWARRMLRPVESEQCMFLSLGVSVDMSHLPSTMRLHLDSPIQLGGQQYNILWLYHYSHLEGYAPDGCSALTLLFQGDSYDFWKRAKEDGTYRQLKADVTSRVVELLYDYLPEIKGHIEATDLATPLTYERYCGSYRGGYMGVWRALRMPSYVPAKSSTVRGLHFAGMRTSLQGGMPIAVQSGYKAAKSL